MTKLLMVCMGNVCRSPMAQIVTTRLVQQAGMARELDVDSAGTHAGRVGEPPDPRAKAALSARGYAVGKSRSRKIGEQDFERYDLILAMDQANLNDLRRICPNEHTHKLRLFLEFANSLEAREIPDPYYGNAQGFERVLDMCEAAGRGLVAYLRSVPR